jgi:uncharacterized membrane protein YgcG
LAPEPDNIERESRLQELEEIEEEERERLVKEALGKFNVFLHVTAWFAGCAYLILLGVLVPKAMPYIWIPVGLWTIALSYHFWRAWHPGTRYERARRKTLKKLQRQEASLAGGDSAKGGSERPDDKEGDQSQ